MNNISENNNLLNKIINNLLMWDCSHEELKDYDIEGRNLETILLDMENDLYNEFKIYLNNKFNLHLTYKINKIDVLRNIKEIIE